MNFVALPVPQIIGGTRKKLGSPWIRPRPLFSKFFNGLLFGWTLWNLNVLAKFEIRSFPRPWDNRGYPKNRAVPGHAQALFSLTFLMGFCSAGAWTLWRYWPNLKSVAFPVPEIIGGTRKNWLAHAPFSQNFLMGFCSDGPCYNLLFWPNLKFV